MIDFNEWIKVELARRGLTQVEAARSLGVSVTTIRRWIRGEAEPRYAELWKVYEEWRVHPFPPRPSP